MHTYMCIKYITLINIYHIYSTTYMLYIGVYTYATFSLTIPLLLETYVISVALAVGNGAAVDTDVQGAS